MGRVVKAQRVGDEIEPLAKHVTQEAINLFEGSAGRSAPSQFTDEATARETLGTEGTVASGRMSLSFALEFLRRPLRRRGIQSQWDGGPKVSAAGSSGRHDRFFGNCCRRFQGGRRQTSVRRYQDDEPARRYGRGGHRERSSAQRVLSAGGITALDPRAIVSQGGLWGSERVGIPVHGRSYHLLCVTIVPFPGLGLAT